MTAKTEIAVKEPATAVETARQSRFTDEQIQAAHLGNIAELPDLAPAKRHFMPMSVEYWSPQIEGEEKYVYVCGIEDQEIPDMESGEIKSLECVLLVERQGDSLVRLINASRVLVGNVRDAITRGEIVPNSTLTPVAIKYLGQKKNKSNAKLSNRWQIVPLIVGVSK